MQGTQVQSLGRKDPLEKEMASHSVFLPGESHGQRSLVGYSPGGCEELDMTGWLILFFSDWTIIPHSDEGPQMFFIISSVKYEVVQ